MKYSVVSITHRGLHVDVSMWFDFRLHGLPEWLVARHDEPSLFDFADFSDSLSYGEFDFDDF